MVAIAAPDLSAIKYGERSRRELARRRLAWYFRKAYPRFDLQRWQEDLCQRLERFIEQCERGESPRLIILAPPQHGKSTIVSRAMPAWLLGRHPDWPLILGSYAKKLAAGHGRWIRNALDSPWHQQVFPDEKCRLAPDSQAVDEFSTMGEGQVLARGVGGGTTGNPAKVFVVDDPFADRKEAESEVFRNNVWDWYSSTVSTRLAPGGGVLVMHTRWHTDDLVGRLIEQSAKDPLADQWEVVTYRAISEEGDDDPIGRKPGEALGRYSMAQLIRKQHSIEVRDWLSLYQQRPALASGTYFKVNMINELRGTAVPRMQRLYQAWDLALTAEKEARGDYSVGACIGIDHLGRNWLVDIERGRWSPDECARKIVKFWNKHQAQRVWLEGGPSYLGVKPSLVSVMRRTGIWVPHEPITHGGKAKDVRAIAIRGIINGGNLYVPADAPWYRELELELASFPSGKHDDQVDALAYLGLQSTTMVANEDDRPPAKMPPAVERSQMVKRSLADIVKRQKAATKGDPREDW